MAKKDGRGGARPNAGRKKLPPTDKKIKVQFYCTPDIEELIQSRAKQIGISRSEYLEQLITKQL